MQDFDTLRDRVEETAQKLTSAQGERQQEIETLVGILRQLEEKYAAQEEQVVFYRDRVEPLEQANEQLSLLMGNLLDLIDNGFGEDSLAPMRQASEMATSMLATDLAPVIDEPSEYIAPPTELDDEQPVAEEAEIEVAAEPDAEMESVVELESELELEPEADPEPEIEAAAETDVEIESPADADADPVGLTTDEVLDLIDSDTEVPELAPESDPEEVGTPEEEIADYPSVVTDFEMEEEALAKLEEDIEPAAEEVPAPVEMTDHNTPVVAEAINELAQEGPITVDEIVSDAEMTEVAMADSDEGAGFEDVSTATLALELEEDAAAGLDDLPELVQIAAAAAAQNTDMEMASPAGMTVDPAVDNDDAVAAESVAPETEMQTTDEAVAIAAIAEAIEAESNAENPTPPAPADIRSLLLRVEALAKKAEAMRMTQDGSADAESVSENAAEAELEADSDQASSENGQKEAGAAA